MVAGSGLDTQVGGWLHDHLSDPQEGYAVLYFLCVVFYVCKLNGLVEDEEEQSMKALVTVPDTLVFRSCHSQCLQQQCSHPLHCDLPSPYSHRASLVLWGMKEMVSEAGSGGGIRRASSGSC